ncbi:hypothetical protein COLO4_36722 [Corchorus olitorius]|uniref:Uncharacterized protein n=1 Tax=Corchorus olitorius TaxID=93759 RepID=A0A1R3G5W9_9ROSI|nr:hypothetical protein COLO4_36722 [Corchorus olitorius]
MSIHQVQFSSATAWMHHDRKKNLKLMNGYLMDSKNELRRATKGFWFVNELHKSSGPETSPPSSEEASLLALKVHITSRSSRLAADEFSPFRSGLLPRLCNEKKRNIRSCGIVTGFIQPLEFGLNWPQVQNYSNH